MKKTMPTLPKPKERPTKGGSYIRNRDGSLTRRATKAGVGQPAPEPQTKEEK